MIVGNVRATASRLILSVLLVAGMAIGVYLAWHHENQVYGDATATLANCPQNEIVNCEVVNSSKWSELLGVPIAAFAIPTYLLVLLLAWGSARRPALAAYAFCVGLLTALCSCLLFYISVTRVGFLCVWCMRLYVVNVSIPVLAGLVAWRSPAALLRQTLGDLRRWPGAMRFTGAAFAALLAVTVAAQQGYRVTLKRSTAAERARIEAQGGPAEAAVPQRAAPAEPPVAPVASSPPEPAPPPPSPPPAAASVASRGPSEVVAPAAPTRQAARKPPANPPSVEPQAPARAVDLSPVPGAYVLAGPLRHVSGDAKGLRTEPSDLQARLGRGKPVALIFWAPGFRLSEEALVEMTGFLKRETPQLDVFAVAGKRDDQRDEEIWERFSLLEVPPALPLLIDDKFVVSGALDVNDVPNLALFSARGKLVVAKIKNLGQMLVVPPGDARAQDVVRRVASGADVPEIKQMRRYYPASDLYAHRAPAFTLPRFGTGEPVRFAGRSPSGRPTLLVFWSSTCKHCQVEIPQMVAWYKGHPGVADIVSVTHIKPDRPGEPSHRRITEAYIRSQGIAWDVLEDPDDAVTELYGSVSTPTTYFISPDGTVVDAWFYAHDQGFEAALDAELAKARSATGGQPFSSRPMPRLAFDLVGSDGKKVALRSLLDRPALVHFWATWCKPCVEELPDLMRFAERLQKDGDGRLILVSVEGQEAGRQIADFERSLKLAQPSYRAPSGGIADKVDLSYRVPRTYVVGKNGDVLAIRQGEQDWKDPATWSRIRSRLANGDFGSVQ